MKHRFSAGEPVYFRGSYGAGAAGTYKVVRALPLENDDRVRYRIKNATEMFERVADEDQLSKQP
jgi:hypothetical protein